MEARDEAGAPGAVVRVEQLYPWPKPELQAVLDRYPNATQMWWVQEEPANMGAWNHVRGKLLRLLTQRGLVDATGRVEHVARRKSASPASGSPKVHEREQHDVIAAALGG